MEEMWNEAAVAQIELLIQSVSPGREENHKKICAQDSWFPGQDFNQSLLKYERHLESKERFAIKKYLLIIGKKKNMQVLSHTFTYFST